MRRSGESSSGEAIEFTATIPPIQSWMQVSGDGGARIKLDVPDTDLAQALKLVLLRGQPLRVRVEVLPQ